MPEPDADPAMQRLTRAYRDRVHKVGAGVQDWAGSLSPSRRNLRADFVAGLPGAISSVPDGMAASVLAGVNPAHGLYASFAGPIGGGLTSSTRLMVVTTTSAAALAAGSALASVPADERSDAMLWLTLLAGGLMVLAALVGLSRYIRFVSHSVMLGFLTGVAVNMVLGQLPDMLGADASGRVALEKALDTVLHPSLIDVPSACTGIAALLILVVLGRTPLDVVSSLVALLVPTVVVLLVGATSVAQVSDSGDLPTGLPMPGIPDLSSLNLSVLAGAASVAVIVLVQGAGVAEAVPNLDGSRSVVRQDFVAQGVGNLASGLFGGQPVGGSVGQTALNVTAGARSRWAAIFSGLWMVAILLVFSGLVGKVMMPTLAAVLVYAGWGTVRPREIATVLRAGRIPAIAFTATFVAVLLLPVATAVGVGVAASLALQLNQEALDLRVVRLVAEGDRRFREERAPATLVGEDVVVLDVYGSLFYAGARTLQRLLPDPVGAEAPVVVLRIRGRTSLGATFVTVVGDYAHRLDAVGGALYLSGVDESLVERWSADRVPEALADVRIFSATAELGESTTRAVEQGRVHRVAPQETDPGDDHRKGDASTGA